MLLEELGCASAADDDGRIVGAEVSCRMWTWEVCLALALASSAMSCERRGRASRDGAMRRRRGRPMLVTRLVVHGRGYLDITAEVSSDR